MPCSLPFPVYLSILQHVWLLAHAVCICMCMEDDSGWTGVVGRGKEGEEGGRKEGIIIFSLCLPAATASLLLCRSLLSLNLTRLHTRLTERERASQ